jgi:hypothetical protein
MDQFKEIIDTYFLNYDLYENGKVVFDCDYGEIIFLKETPTILTLFGIYIYPEYRQQGFCRSIIHYLIEKSKTKFNFILFESVMSKILYEYLLRFKYENKKFKLIKEGFIYKIESN